ncbi:unnamed protein product [Nippostrongylus brasiliensis]|uniref:FAM192A_Fyv6_N domain-containing protein n=1 Tax=Nippostrongylus brasiliensis TaxID=27835 RepID=A0A0N4YM38_NIPBR|nr:unnamed protein product [Nippostrongylus brasiliensis]
MGFSDEDRCYKAEVDEDTESPGKMKDCEIGKEPAKRAPLKRDQTQMCEDDLELAHFYQERVYEREKVRDEELLSFKDWRRRIRAAQLRENARRRKTVKVSGAPSRQFAVWLGSSSRLCYADHIAMAGQCRLSIGGGYGSIAIFCVP